MAVLRAHEPELRDLGITRLSLFGSVARGEQDDISDVDLAAHVDHGKVDLYDFAAINVRLTDILGCKVDLVNEPARRPAFQHAIERDRVLVF
ncbi:MAG: nucleotidyltransferase family protein [Sphingomonadaceae bacterium]